MQRLKILNTHFITHNVKRFVLEKPKGFEYTPGQSAQISIDQKGWEDQIRPFTFTSLQHWDHLEFIIKIYEDHEGVTAQLGKLNTGAELLLHDVYGTIQYKGPGIFIAGGTGITPFIAIFRALFESGNLRNLALLYSNKTKEDIILHDELTKMLGPAYRNVFTQEGVIGFRERRIDRKFLIETIGDFNSRFYVCGPQKFTEEICDALISLGADPEYLII
ncbi:FAD-binding oxidoreductase [Aequorivita antarctica]|uniref:Flavodoxin reductase n=1 Tax=Aequorivita antarctica TaxID=153266 RepID=A0A5C6Z4A6_9FLAO|nr:FAD-binding oxidoreductase [Aequorivita antarctica]TXD74723.1 flavodoxin reductase [Aequorivita antarctica]SRX72587.1 Ferredoxin--NAD(P)(+) reductase (naphthalene dioxygenase ferredoxin-specific) [Aequorivita antarctica]